MTFRELVQAKLAERQWTYSQLAQATGLHVSLISRVLRGQRRPTVAFVRACAEALDLPLVDLLQTAGLVEEAVATGALPGAEALAPYVQYAATPEGEEEIATRLAEKVARLEAQRPLGRKVAQLLDWVRILARRFTQLTGPQKALVGGALLYFLAPVDLVPDFVPGAGLLDDLNMVALTLSLVASAGDGASE